ncbi:hypothetical protein VYU27_001006 [Nannochloropsis oceanica]
MASSRTCPTNATPPSPLQALEFLRVVGKLKTLKRTGWVNNGVELPESVADHMYRMAMCSFLITDPALDRARLMKLAIVHDLAEALVGDIVPHDVRYTKEQKRVLEEEAIKSIARDLGHDSIGAEVVSLWLEYEDQSTPEARVVKDFDKFEMIVQADEYERAQPNQDLTDFFQSTEGAFQHPQVVAWDEELRRQRDTKLKRHKREG